MYVLEKIRLSVPIEISFRYIGRNFQQIGQHLHLILVGFLYKKEEQMYIGLD